MTHALEMSAIMRGRASAAYARAMTAYTTAETAPEPKPWIARPAMTSGMDGARPETTRPIAKSAVPMTSGRAGPDRSVSEPPTVMPMMFVSQKALNAQP